MLNNRFNLIEGQVFTYNNTHFVARQTIGVIEWIDFLLNTKDCLILVTDASTLVSWMYGMGLIKTTLFPDSFLKSNFDADEAFKLLQSDKAGLEYYASTGY